MRAKNGAPKPRRLGGFAGEPRPTDGSLSGSATVSSEAAKALAAVYAVSSRRPPPSKPTGDDQRAALDKFMIPASIAVAAKLGANVRDDMIGGIPIVRILPAGYKPNGRTLIYTHSGAYTSQIGRHSGWLTRGAARPRPRRCRSVRRAQASLDGRSRARPARQSACRHSC